MSVNVLFIPSQHMQYSDALIGPSIPNAVMRLVQDTCPNAAIGFMQAT